MLALSGLALQGCQTSCGKSEDPVLWADGVTTTNSGVETYLTTPIDGKWLHFPSYRSFRLPHHFGTTDIALEAWVSFDEHPVTSNASDPPTEFAIAGGNVVVVTELTKDELIVKNSTCENGYYLLARITKRGP